MALGFGPLSDLPLGAVPAASGGGGSVTGDLSITLGAVTVASTGALAIKADASITLGAVTVSSDATLVAAPSSTRNPAWENDVGRTSWAGTRQGPSRWRGRRVYIYAEPEPVVTTTEPPKRVKAKRQNITPAMLQEAWATMFPTPLPAQVAEAAPSYAYVQSSLPQGHIIAAIASYLQRQAMAELEDEDEIEMLLLAA